MYGLKLELCHTWKACAYTTPVYKYIILCTKPQYWGTYVHHVICSTGGFGSPEHGYYTSLSDYCSTITVCDYQLGKKELGKHLGTWLNSRNIHP